MAITSNLSHIIHTSYIIKIKTKMNKRFVFLFIASFLFVFQAIAQFSFGPAISLSNGLYDKIDTAYKNIDGKLNPSFGILAQRKLNYWLDLRGKAMYSFKTMKVNSPSTSDYLTGQYLDLLVNLNFSGFDAEKKFLPYADVGLGNSFLIASRGGDFFLSSKNLKPWIPFFDAGIGCSFKLSYSSHIDLNLSYNRYLTSIYQNNNIRFNQFNFKLGYLFTF